MSSEKVPRESLDACRPGHDDLSLPELAALREALAGDAALAAQLDRITRFDRQLAAALHDVPLPPGLAERILARCETFASEPSSIEGVVAPCSAPTPRPGALQSFVNDRRRLLRSLAATAAGLLGGCLAWRYWPRAARVVPPHEIAASLDRWLAQAGLPPGPGWKPPDSLPPGCLPPAIHTPAQAWKRFRTPQGWTVLAVELVPPGQPRATLLIVESSARFEVPSRPYLLLSTSMARTAAAWASQGTLFVLVVEQGGKPRLDQFVRPSPVA